ncbi:TPA: tyrosine-type recombinase/integrase [Vibrio parahaemolyticus]|nr:tyrosine-type recombinase/integrase [Vibrio parahaemolyticus]
MNTPITTSTKDWDVLISTPLNSFEDLVNPSITLPHRQLMHLFASVYKAKTSKSRRADLKCTYNHVSQLMTYKLGNQPVYLSLVLNEFSLDEFHAYLTRSILDEKIHNRYANVLQSTYKIVLNKTLDISIPNFERFYLPSSFCYNTRITERYKPYSNFDRERITKAIDMDIDKYSKLLKPYRKKSQGRDVVDKNGKLLLKKGDDPTLEDARWLFENKMDCIPMSSSYDFHNSRIGSLFYKIINKNGMYYQDVYQSWGVLSKVTIDHLLPFLLKLLQITGMNVEAIYSLDIDDLVEKHPATGKPCLRYWKERSDGQKLYHLDIFKADLQWLTNSQGSQVKLIFDTVIKLTSSLREKAPAKQKNKLWLFETHNGLIKALPLQHHLTKAIKSFSERHHLFDLSSGEKTLETTRFRPTFVSDLVNQGVSIREIQLLMGHKSLYTTMRYLDMNDFGQSARVKIREKLIEIHKNAHSSVSKKANEVTLDCMEPVHISTPLATCKNIFDPPSSVKSLPNYVPGKPCSTYNMCLSCPNVIITKTDLPKLFSMRRDYLVKIQNSRILDTPFGDIIKNNLALVNSILDIDVSEFSAQELEEAERLSLYIETNEFI